MPPYPLPDTDPSYTMQPGSFDPQGAVPKMDPGSMSRLFGGDDDQGGGDQASDQATEADGQDTDQAQGPPDRGKLQSVLSDPGLMMSVAQVLKTLGTGDDTDLVHVTDREKQILKRAGGKGTVNPTTGLLQYASSGANDAAPGIDWYNMHPDARVAHIGSMYQSPPGWKENWWSTPDVAQGGPVGNLSNAAFASANTAVNPSWGNALGMAGLVTSLGMGGPLGLAMSLGGKALANSILGKSEITDPFADPGPALSPDVTASIGAMPTSTGSSTQSLVARDTALQAARAAANIGAATPGAAPVGGYSSVSTSQGPMLGGNFTSFGGAALAANAAAGNIDAGSGTIGGRNGGGGGGGQPGGDKAEHDYGGGGLGGGPGAEGAGHDPGGPPGSH